jgi:hypothetical protein
MKIVRMVAAFVIVLCAVVAAYFSYTQTIGQATPMVSSSKGPPRGFAPPSARHAAPTATGAKSGDPESPPNKSVGRTTSAAEKGDASRDH